MDEIDPFAKKKLFEGYCRQYGIIKGETENYDLILSAFLCGFKVAEKRTAKRCRYIAEKSYLSKSKTADIDELIAEEFDV